MNNKIKQRRAELNLSQIELADKLGITVSWLSKIESGKKNPTMQLALRIAIALDCEVSQIFLD